VKVLVLGGYGAVGARIVAQLQTTGDVALSAGRDPARADRVIDLRERANSALRLRLPMWTSWSTQPDKRIPAWFPVFPRPRHVDRHGTRTAQYARTGRRDGRGGLAPPRRNERRSRQYVRHDRPGGLLHEYYGAA